MTPLKVMGADPGADTSLTQWVKLLSSHIWKYCKNLNELTQDFAGGSISFCVSVTKEERSVTHILFSSH